VCRLVSTFTFFSSLKIYDLYWLLGTSVRKKLLLRRRECAFIGCKWMCTGGKICGREHVLTRQHENQRIFLKEQLILILSRLKRLIGTSVSVLRTRYVHWTTPLTSSLPLGTRADLTRSKAELMAENALLRQQLIILKRQVKRPACTKTDRLLLVLLARVVRTWNQAHITRSTRHEARAGIVGSSACTGSAGQRPLHTSPR